MGVDVHILIRHDFHELDDFEKSMAFVRKTINAVRQRLSVKAGDEMFELYGYYYDDVKFSNIEFRIPTNNAWVHLHKGYWNIWTGSHTCQLTNKIQGRVHIADLAFDTAMALGGTEAWYCDEFLADDCDFKTLDELLKIAKKRHGITEYPYGELMKCGDNEFPDFKAFYHDSFTDIQKEYHALQKRCGDYRLTCIRNFGQGLVRVEKNGKINLVSRESGERALACDLDDIIFISGSEIVAVRDNKVALLDGYAQYLTPFVEGEFKEEWKWECNLQLDNGKYLYNETAQIRIMAIYKNDGKVEYSALPYNGVWVRRKPVKCPVCKGKVLPVVYGYPSPKLSRRAQCGEVILGGCIITDHSADWMCCDCQTEFLKLK